MKKYTFFKDIKYILVVALCLFTTIFSARSQRVITIEQALEQAVLNNPDIRQARLQLEQNRQNLVAQRASLKSKFSLEITPISYSHEKSFNNVLGEWVITENTSSMGTLSVLQPVKLTDGTIALKNNLRWQDAYTSYAENQFKGFSNNIYLSINQPIFTYNKTQVALKDLELAYENSQLYYAIQMLSMEKFVTMAFYNVYQAQQDVEIGKEEYENRKTSFDIIQNKVDAGLSAREEFFQAELNLFNSESNLYNKQVAVENMGDNFKQMLGIPLEEEIVVLAEINLQAVNVDLNQAIQQGLSARMELRQRQIDIDQGIFRITEAKAFNEFKGDININIGLFGENEKLHRIYEKPVNNQDISLSFTIPIYDWGEKRAKLKAAQAAQEIRIYNFEEERVNIVMNVRKIVRELVNLQNQMTIAQKNEQNAARTYDLSLEKYKNGDLTSMDLNLVQNQLTQQKQNLTNAIIQYKLGLLDLKIQTMYDYEKNIQILPIPDKGK